MNGRQSRDALRDVLALVGANIHDDDDAARLLSVATLRRRDGETTDAYIDRLSFTFDLLAAVAAEFIGRWAEKTPFPTDVLFRDFAERIETESSRRDLDETNS